MSTPEDLAPSIARFLAEASLEASVSDLTQRSPAELSERWARMLERFPKATLDEVRRGTAIAIELINLRSEELVAEVARRSAVLKSEAD
jgi:hypothetical protein